LVVDPFGRVLADAKNEEGISLVDLDLKMIEDVRARMPVQQHRRNDIYILGVKTTRPTA
jgi:predicted amidohydrolase